MYPEIINKIWVILFGLIVGSFLNVLIYRLPEDKSIIKPGSHCPHCQAKIRWYQNIPVLSWLILKGKCASCSSRISFVYPLVELLTAILFLMSYLRFGMSVSFALYSVSFISILVVVTFIDLKHRIIPDVLSVGGTLLGVLLSFVVSAIDWQDSLLGALCGFGAFYLLALTYYKFTKKEGLGGGDIKLIAMIGAYLGLKGVFYTIFLSSILGSVVGIGFALLYRKKVLTYSIPYGPFLAASAMIYYFLGDLIWPLFMIPM